MALLQSSDKYCTYSYWYDMYGMRNATEYCSITNVYPGFTFDDVYTTYQTNSYYAPVDDIISYDDYCTWDYGFWSDTETCTATKYYTNGDAISYTDTYIH